MCACTPSFSNKEFVRDRRQVIGYRRHTSFYDLRDVYKRQLLLGLQHDKNGKNFQCGRNFLDFSLIGMLCAVTDETIQIFSGRGSLVSDVWIDTAGFSTGFFLTVLLFLFINHCKKAG